MTAKLGLVNVVRDLGATSGASFFTDEEGNVLFRFVIDSGNIIGPRPAQKSDSENHPEAWQAFVASGAMSTQPKPAKAAKPQAKPA